MVENAAPAEAKYYSYTCEEQTYANKDRTSVHLVACVTERFS
jgi:hypothetical protein